MNAVPEKIREVIGPREQIIFWRMPNGRLLVQVKDKYSNQIVESFNNHPLHGYDEQTLAEKFEQLAGQIEAGEYTRPAAVKYTSRPTYQQTDLFKDE